MGVLLEPIEIEPDLAERLQRAAEAAGLSMSDYAGSLIAQGLEAQDWTESLRRLQDYDAGRSVAVDAKPALDRFLQTVRTGGKSRT